MLRKSQRAKLILAFGPPLLIALLLLIFTYRDISTVLNEITLPPLAPNRIVIFFISLMVILLLSGASFFIYNSHVFSDIKKRAILFFIAHLSLIFVWSLIFFNKRLFGLSFLIEILILALLGITTLLYYRIDKRAGFLLFPYVVWQIYVAYQNLCIMFLN